MVRKPSAFPRKKPAQSRAKVTVESILDAAALVLADTGTEAFTTNRVAERAGVSIGSLYQYYPNKQALLVALHQRHREGLLSRGTNILTEFRGESLQDAIARLIRGIIASHMDSGGLHRSVAKEVPGSFAEPTIHELVLLLFEDHRAEIGVKDLQLASYLFCVSAKAVIHDALSERPHDLRNGKIEDALVRMLANYLAQSR